ncbi:MAG: hypothetical protein ABIN97_11645 [Ginsengibacter sp.]
MKFILSLIFLSLFLLDNQPTKKDVLLSITKKYLPENYIVLKNYDEATINMLAEGDSLQDFILDYPVVVHEAFHLYEHSINNPINILQHFRVNDSLTISIKKFNSFPSRFLIVSVPKKVSEKISRYNTYINSPDTNYDTQQNGFFGLLEEYDAYYQSLKAYTFSFYFLRDTFSWSNPIVWINYLNKAGSEVYAVNEFKLFFSWYLQYSKLKRQDIFKKITTDKNVKILFKYIEKKSQELINDFLKNRAEILKNIKPFTEFDNDGFIKLKGQNTGYGINEHMQNLKFTDSLLKETRNKILNFLRE